MQNLSEAGTAWMSQRKTVRTGDRFDPGNGLPEPSARIPPAILRVHQCDQGGKVTHLGGTIHPLFLMSHSPTARRVRKRLCLPSRDSNITQGDIGSPAQESGSNVSGHILEIKFYTLHSGRPKSGKDMTSQEHGLSCTESLHFLEMLQHKRKSAQPIWT